MGPFTFIPVWVIQDVLVLAAGIMTVIYIIKKEKHPEIFLLEMFCFVLLYAAVYENFATLIGLYGFGRSVLMVGNVPLTVPLVEYLVIYATLRWLKHMEIPLWCKPFIVGFSGMLFDFTLDPLAIKQVFATNEAVIGRWSWFPGPLDANIYGVTVYNFSGWMLILGYASLFLVLGRWLYSRSQYKPWVGFLYPVIGMLASLAILVSPVSNFLLWLGPFFAKGSFTEWIMLAVHLCVPVLLLLIFWRGRMKGELSIKKNYPVFIILCGFHLFDIIFTLIGGFWEIFWLELLFTGLHLLLVFFPIILKLPLAFRKKNVLKKGIMPEKQGVNV